MKRENEASTWGKLNPPGWNRRRGVGFLRKKIKLLGNKSLQEQIAT